MNQRTVILLLAGVPVLLGVIYLAWLHHFTLADYDRKIEEARTQIGAKSVEARKISRDADMRRWRDLSLPPDSHLAQREYSRYLHDLLRGKFTDMSLQPNAPMETKGSGTLSKKTMYTSLPFNVRGKTTLEQLAAVLEKFQRTPVVHKIKSMSLERESGSDEKDPLNVQLVVEALIIDGVAKGSPNISGFDARLVAVDAFSGLRRGPVGLALVPWVLGPRGPFGPQVALATPRRDYADIAARNIFTGAPAPKPPPPPVQPPVEVAKEPEPEPEPDDTPIYVYLTEINQGQALQEAFLFNRATNKSMRLSTAEGYDIFPVGNDPRTRKLVSGKVVRIAPRDMFYKIGEAIYGIHIGQTLSESLRRPLRQSEVGELRLGETSATQGPRDGDKQ